MGKESAAQKALYDICDSGDFQQLEKFKEPKKWERLGKVDRTLLANLFVSYAELQFEGKNPDVVEFIELAGQVSPGQPELLVRQAQAFVSHPQNALYIARAIRSLEEAVVLKPLYFEAWRIWGSLLLKQALETHEFQLAESAIEKFVKAEGCTRKKIYLGELYWEWGLAHSVLAKHSEEAVDYSLAITKFKQAEKCNVVYDTFWINYAHALTGLATLVGREDLVHEAIAMYNRVIKKDPNRADVMLQLAQCYQYLYTLDYQEPGFELANEYFKQTATLAPQSFHLFWKWGEFLMVSAKMRMDQERLQEGLKNLEHASTCGVEDPRFFAPYGEACRLAGVQQHDLSWLRKSQAIFDKALQEAPDCVDLHYFYGLCLHSLGDYFEDASFYEQATAKFQKVLSIDPRCANSWYGLAAAHLEVGKVNGDPEALEKATIFFSRAVEYAGDRVPSEFWDDWAIALMRLGLMTGEADRMEEAIEKYEHLLNNYRSKDPQAPSSTEEIEWIYNYGCALDFFGEMLQDVHHHERAVKVLSQLLQRHPEFRKAGYNLALSLAHVGELNDDTESLIKAGDYFDAYVKEEREDEKVWDEWAVSLIHLAILSHDPSVPERAQKLLEQAEQKLVHASSLGSHEASYHLACLYSLTGHQTASLDSLMRAKLAHALPPLDYLMHDKWLVALRETDEFQDFLKSI